MSDTPNPAELPPLPKPAAEKKPEYDLPGVLLFTSKQMQDYARAAIAADRAQLAQQGQGKPVAWLLEWADGAHRLAFPSSVQERARMRPGKGEPILTPLVAPASAQPADVSVIDYGNPVDKSAAPQPAARAAVPDGYVLVPKVPTDEMVVAFAEEWYSRQQTIDDPQMNEAYAAMLAALTAPAQPLLAPCEGGPLLPDSCADCRREGGPCAIAQAIATVAPTAQQAAPMDYDYTDPTLACSDCGLTMGESRLLGHLKLGLLTAAPATTGMAGQLNAERVFEIATPFFIWNAPSWHKATEGTVNMTNLLAFTQAVIYEARMAGQDAKDAARYRWLKDHWGKRTPILNGIRPVGAADAAFDAGIDHAIAMAAQQAQASAKDRYLEASADLDAATDNFYGQDSATSSEGDANG